MLLQESGETIKLCGPETFGVVEPPHRLRHRHTAAHAGRVGLQGARHSGDKYFRCARPAQNSRALRNRSAGGEDIVHQQDLSASDCLRPGHCKRTPDVFAALMTRESGLGLGFATSLQNPRLQDGPAASRPKLYGIPLDGSAGDQLRLVEAALA